MLLHLGDFGCQGVDCNLFSGYLRLGAFEGGQFAGNGISPSGQRFQIMLYAPGEFVDIGPELCSCLVYGTL